MTLSDLPAGRVAVVGAGPAGTTLALGLLHAGWSVTLVSDRTAEEIRDGRVMSSQVTFESALEVEAALGVTALLPTAPGLARLSYDLRRADGSTSAAFSTDLAGPARSVDLRVKVPAVLDEVARLGGKVVVLQAEVADVEELASTHDLVVVSTGRGGLGELFDVDEERTTYGVPQRRAVLTYLRGVTPDPAGPGLRYHAVEGVGECFTCPALTLDGACDVVVLEAVPGGPFDRFEDVTDDALHLARLREVLEEHVPGEAARMRGAVLVDDRSTLRGAFPPLVRRPVGLLPSGRPVLGMADVVVLNDPVTSQGSNTALKSASFYLEAITHHRDTHAGADFDAAWMERTFDSFWQGWARFVTRWTTSWLEGPQAHQVALLAGAADRPDLAAGIAAGFDDARLFEPWWFDAEAATALLAPGPRSDPRRFDARDLRQALGQYATGVTVVTAEHEGQRVAMTANSFTSVSLDPPLVLWAAARSAPSLAGFEVAERFAVNVLAADQHHLSRQFAISGVDKFDAVPLTGEDPPVLAGAVATFVCRRTDRIEAGDHVVFLAEIESYDAPGGEPLVFHSGAYRVATKHPDL